MAPAVVEGQGFVDSPGIEQPAQLQQIRVVGDDRRDLACALQQRDREIDLAALAGPLG